MKLRAFIRHSRCPMFAVKLNFFQHTSNLHRYSRSITRYNFVPNYTRTYRYRNGPQAPDNKKLYGLAGHYGMYYTIFQRSPDHDKNQIDVLTFDPFLSFNGQRFGFNEFINFTISGLNRVIMNDISNLKVKSQKLSASSLILKRSYSMRVSTDIEEPIKVQKSDEDSDDTFETSQISLIEKNFQNHNYDVIYPIYQSLTRNGLSLPSTELYNVVLSSLIYRGVNSQTNIDDIESRLTNLLTVYQDLLNISTETLKPNDETFNLIISELLQGSAKTLEIRDSVNLPNIIYNESFIKCQEFVMIAIELMMSVKKFQNLDLNSIYPKLFKVLNSYPNLVSPEILTLIFNNLIKNSSNFEYYSELIKLTRFFNMHSILTTDKQCYDFILHNYQLFQSNKELIESSGSNFTMETFRLYGVLIVELVRTNNFEVATQFLNTILNDFKSNTYNNEITNEVSNLLSNYLSELAEINLDESLKLANQFNQLHYLPELSMSYYNKLIDRMISSSDINESYDKIWTIVDYNIARKDFKLNSSLVNLAIDSKDSEKVFKLTKIILLNDELIDPMMLKKLLQYFGRNYQVVSNLIEHQAKYYNDHNKINEYLSDIVPYLISGGSPEQYTHIVNSFMVKDCFNKVNFLEDKLYGVTEIARFLISQTPQTEEEFLKAMNLKCTLVCELENPELVYFNLDEDLTKFKASLFEDITSNWSKATNYTNNMIEAGKYLDLVPSNEETIKLVPRVDLGVLLNLNYDLGVSKFIELFNKGFKFNYNTLNMLINYEFLTKNLNWDKFIIDMIEIDSSMSLINRVISLNIDNMNVSIMKHLSTNKLINDTNYQLLLDSLLTSDNQYFFNKFKLIERQMTSEQVMQYIEILGNFNDFESLKKIIENTPNLDMKQVSNILNNDLSSRIIKSFDNSGALQQLAQEPQVKTAQQNVIDGVLTKVLQLIKVDQRISFQSIMNSLSVLGLNHLSVVNFQKLIQVLTHLKQESVLNILLNKFLELFNGGSLLRFDNLQVLITGLGNKIKVLNSFKQSFQTLNCEINLIKINYIEHQSNYN